SQRGIVQSSAVEITSTSSHPVSTGETVMDFEKLAHALPHILGLRIDRVFLVGHDRGRFQVRMAFCDENRNCRSYEFYGVGWLSGAKRVDDFSAADLRSSVMHSGGWYLELGPSGGPTT